MTQIEVAFILGEGYSGSTLLDLILGSHSRMLGLGEIDAEAFDAFLDENQLCTCLFPSRECHFWRKVLSRLGDSFRLGAAKGDLSEVTKNTIDLLQAVKAASSAEILVDSSKRIQRVYRLAESGLIRPKVIHLIRDGRGVGYSRLKRGEPFRQAVLQWKSNNAEIKDWLESGGAPDNISVKYEDLCAQPGEVARRICDFLNVAWEPQMIRIGQKAHHNVRGNPMRFMINKSLIRLDDTWKYNLGEEDLNSFEELVGPFSYQLGYQSIRY